MAVGTRTTNSGRPVRRSSWSNQTVTTRPATASAHSTHTSQARRQRDKGPRAKAVTALVLA
ncbi:MAG TPA: hypothetical protein VHA34_00805, partial [Actinomycetes bacterium]|nr:hypothetical protein [Actinomycetes bacterium]